ncbi:hypothetical protein ACFLRI_05390, partial [Bacteroidota bacterium]
MMKTIFKIIPVILLICFSAMKSHATHARAGEIVYKQIGDPKDYKYEITVIYYTESNSPANRDDIDLYFGDNTKENVKLEIRNYLGNNTYYNTYKTIHIYPGPGKYTITFFDPNRIENIQNMSNSVLTPFYIETYLEINSFTGINRSPILLQPPIDYAEINQVYVHNPGAYDPDGDSLVFTLIAPKMDVGKNVIGYYKPYAKNGFKLDHYTGDLVWDYPDTMGIFNIAILIEEFRNKKRIGYIIRDMQIIVEKGINHPPQIEPISDTCIEAGKSITLTIPVKAHDLDVNQLLIMTANGGPFTLTNSPAVMIPKTITGNKDINATFTWTPDCDHIRKEPYAIVIKVVDNHPLIPLADLEHFFIKVMGPAPENFTLTNTIKGIGLNWDKPAICNNVRGYNIYRRVDSSFWDTTVCENGIPPATGFVRIAKLLHPDSTFFLDDDNGNGLVPGVNYCYRVTAIYMSEGNFELVEGYATQELCGRQKKDLPVITHVSILQTDETNGIVFMEWSKPTELDTNLFKGPYENRILKSENGTPFFTYKSFKSADFYGLKDTVLVDSFQNTQNHQLVYQVAFYGSNNSTPYFLGKAQSASSIFLELKPSHEKMYLNWDVHVPWFNEYFVIYRKKSQSSAFDSVGYTSQNKFTDLNLINGETYCYVIKSFGNFSMSTGFVSPIINYSQEVCAMAIDTIPPCPPEIRATAFCPEHRNELVWNYNDPNCAVDVVGYNIYFSRLKNNKFELVNYIAGINSTSYND